MTTDEGLDKNRIDRLGKLLLAITAFSIAAFLIRETVDLDPWWHIGIGRYILETFSVPYKDYFTTAALGNAYHDSQWLFQVMLALADRAGGQAGVSVVMIAIWGGIFYFSYRSIRHWSPVSIACILLFIVALACSDRFTPRPDLVTCLFIAIFYNRLQEDKYKTAPQLLLLVGLQAVWANMHGLFVIGPFLAGCYLIEGLMNRFRGKESDYVKASILTGVITGATLLNPYGFDVWRFALLLSSKVGATAPEVYKHIPELFPTFGKMSMKMPDFYLFAAILVSTLGSIAYAIFKGKISPARLLIICGLFIAAYTARRNVPLFILTAGPFVVENFSSMLVKMRIPVAVYAAIGALMLLSTWFPFSGKLYRMMHYPTRFGIGASPSFFPNSLPEFLKKTDYKGQIYNSNSLGGFCLYHGYRPLSDTRLEIYSDNQLMEIIKAGGESAAWDRLVEKYAIKGVLLQHSSPEAGLLLPRLKNDTKWRLVYYDHAASFWESSTLHNLPAAAGFEDLTGRFNKIERIEELVMLNSFLINLGRLKSVGEIAAKGLNRWGEDETLVGQLGRAQLDTGEYSQAEATYQRLYRINPKNIEALNELAFFAFNKKDIRGAADYLRRALALDPGNTEIQANYNRIKGMLR